MINQIFFGYFAGMILLTSLLVISRKNPVHSVLWMLVMFFHIAGLYLFLNAEFMAAVQIIVYAGAILVLFLFVLFLLNLKFEPKEKQLVVGWPLGFTAALAIMLLIMIPLTKMQVKADGPWSIAAVTKTTHTVAVGTVLYTDYLFPFEVTSLILLVAIVGAVMLAKGGLREKEDK